MKEIKVFDKGEKVLIEVEVIGVTIKDSVPAYRLKNPQTGHPFDYTFSEDQIFCCEDNG